MEIVNIRVDDRLIHGQVATVWTLATRATRMMVVDDDVVHDQLHKEALKLACPQGRKLSILTAKKAAENLLARQYVGERVFILVKNPRTLREMYDGGFRFTHVTVGNMGGKTGTRVLQKAVSVDEADIENFQYLINHGVKVTAQMVPSDAAAELSSLLQT